MGLKNYQEATLKKLNHHRKSLNRYKGANFLIKTKLSQSGVFDQIANEYFHSKIISIVCSHKLMCNFGSLITKEIRFGWTFLCTC